MKQRSKLTLIVPIIVGICVVIFAAPSGAQDNATTAVNAKIATIELTELTAKEVEGILFMRQEEKLARDVYRVIYDKWGVRIFKNIANSEQTHMDALARIVVRYGLEDPISEEIPGTFPNETLQLLYKELTERGGKSFDEALIVGAQIEELDIADLERWLATTDNEDVRIVYQNLMKGSRNHLRSFYRQIERSNLKYTPSYLSADIFNRIVTSPQERGGAILDPNYIFK